MAKPERNSSVKERNSTLFVEEPRLIVTIISAKHLFAKDPNGYSDPYVVVNYGSTKYKTKAASKTVSPFWNETFVVDIESLTGELDIQVWHKDTSKFIQEMKDEDLIGHVVIPLSILQTAPIQCGHFKLLPKNPDAFIKELGQISLALIHTTNKEIECKHPSDKKAREDFFCGYMTKLGGRGVLQNWKKRWFVLQRSKLSYYENETNKQEAIFSIDLEKDVEKLYMENPNKFSFSLETKVQGNRTFLIMAESDKMMARWMTLIDGVKYFCVNSKKFLSSMDPTLKKTLLTQLYFKNIKGGPIKFFRNTGSDPNKGFHTYEVTEQWDYAPEGVLSCTLGPFNGLSYKWDGQSLRVYDNKNRNANLAINRNIIAGHGFWDGFRLGWCDSAGDIVDPFNYYYDGYQFVNTNVLKYSCSRLINLFTVELMTELNGHWLYTGEVPEPVVMFIIIIKLMHPDQFKKSNSQTDLNSNSNKLTASSSTGSIGTALKNSPSQTEIQFPLSVTEEPKKEEPKKEEIKKEEPKKEEPKKEEPKKEEIKKEEPKKEEIKKEEPKKEQAAATTPQWTRTASSNAVKQSATSPAASTSTSTPQTQPTKEEPKKEEPKNEEIKKEEPKKEEIKKEEPKKEEPKKEEPKKEEPHPQQQRNGTTSRRKMSLLEDSDDESIIPPARPPPQPTSSSSEKEPQPSSSPKEGRNGTLTGPRRKLSLLEESDEETTTGISRNSSSSVESTDSDQNSSNSQQRLSKHADEERTLDQKSVAKDGSSSGASSTRNETSTQQQQHSSTTTSSGSASSTPSSPTTTPATLQRRPSNWITAKVRMDTFQQ